MKDVFDLISFLEDRVEYTNRHGIVIDLFRTGIYICSCFPGFEDKQDYISLDLCREFKTVSAFTTYFSIRSNRDLENICPEQLLEHFAIGNMDVYCNVYDPYFGGDLRFRKNENGLFGYDEDTDKYHFIPTLLSSANDFVQHTCNYFLQQSNTPAGKVDFSKS